jgi:hypothetical protein
MANHEARALGKLITRHKRQGDVVKVEGLMMVMMLPFGGNRIRQSRLDYDLHYQLIVSKTFI